MEKPICFVQMPLDKYDQLILENKRMMDKLDKIVTIKKRWDDRPALYINLDVLKETIKEKFLQSEFAANYILNELDSKEEIYGAFKYVETDTAIGEEDQA